jgi:hypothetical protein
MEDKRLKISIEEGVSKGVPLDFIAYSLNRAGWPEQMVQDAIDAWRLENGRVQKTTDFKVWLRSYYTQAKASIALVVVLNVITSSIMLLNPWPIKIMADSVFGHEPAPGPLASVYATKDRLLAQSAH